MASATDAPSKPRPQPRPQPRPNGMLASFFDMLGEIPAGLAKWTGGIIPAHATARALRSSRSP